MKNNSPKHLALKTLIKHKHYSLNNYADLKRIIESNQFAIIEYKKHTSQEPVSELIKKLKVENEIENSDSFLYINNNLKFVFINADVPDEDRCSLLRHELGHILDTDFKSGTLYYSRIQKEEFANEFSCYTKKPPIHFMVYVFLAKKWKLLASVTALIFCVLAFMFIHSTLTISPTKPVTSNDSAYTLSDSKYYVTSSGKKYHKKHCIIIMYKNNLTEIKLNDAINYGYKPCMICNPEEVNH